MKPAHNPTGRQPADVAVDGRQDMWLALKKKADGFTVTDVVTATGVNRTTALRYLKSLVTAGFLTVDEPEPGQAAVYCLVKDVGFHAPRVRADGSKISQGEAIGQLWVAMLGLKDFDFRELMQSASIEIPEATAKDYCKRLLSAGYLRVLAKANPARGKIARYRLIRASGPRAPQVQKVPQVYDPNTGATYSVEAGQ